MSSRIVRIAVVSLCIMGMGATAAVYTWIADGDGTTLYDWDVGGNWSRQGICGPVGCWPNTANDDAIFDGQQFDNEFKVRIEQNLTIDDLVVTTLGEGGGEFDGDGQERTVTCDSLVITGTTGDVNHGVRVVKLAGIQTQ